MSREMINWHERYWRNIRIIEDYIGGASTPSLGRKYHLNAGGIRFILFSVPIPRRAYTPFLSEQQMRLRGEIFGLREQGLTFAEIGKRYGVSRQRIQQIHKTEKEKRGTWK